MSTQAGLHGARVVVTRPVGQADALLRLLKDSGAQPCHIPLLAIKPVAETPRLRQRIMDLDRYRIIVCVSPNAARLLLEWVDLYWPQLPLGVDWYCVGPGTARVLADYGIDAAYPAQGETSEALLARPELQDVAEARVLICRGEGGRELLAETLDARGARVEYLELYRRVMPALTPAQARQLCDADGVDALLLSSGQALAHLQHWLQAQPGSACRDKLVVVPSERVAQQARAWGFRWVVDAGGASDPLMVEALRRALSTRTASR